MNNDELKEDISVEGGEITPKDLLIFAKYILLFVFISFIGGCYCNIFYPDSDVFEACKSILPSMTTLVIGFYFGKNS